MGYLTLQIGSIYALGVQGKSYWNNVAVVKNFYLHIIYLKKKYIESYNHLDILHGARDINYGPRLKSLF